MEKQRFTDLIGEYTAKSVLVVGDYILDEYLIGDTKRVSREAPVVVIDYCESVFNPGGAANAAQNVTAMGAGAMALGITGADNHGEILREILRERGAGTDGLIAAEGVSTALKTRILAGELNAQKQQVARIDRSYRVTSSLPELGVCEKRVEGMIDACDAVIISDYGMGVVPGPLSESVIGHAKKKGIPVVVDSRFLLTRFPGATVGTPNEVELFNAMKATSDEMDDLETLAKRALVDADIWGLIITRGSRGMLVCDAESHIGRIGIVGTSDVTDVTGAGDTVAATVALALASGASLLEAAEMATYAASIVVMKRGTATVSPGELIALHETTPKPDATVTGVGH